MIVHRGIGGFRLYAVLHRLATASLSLSVLHRRVKFSPATTVVATDKFLEIL
jgi:hypothetical protein